MGLMPFWSPKQQHQGAEGNLVTLINTSKNYQLYIFVHPIPDSIRRGVAPFTPAF